MSTKGFTLIETLVSVAVFSVVMVVTLGALLALSSASRKAQAISAAVNNISFALDSMTRAIRTGTQYHCGTGGTLTSPADCPTPPGDTYFTFLDTNGNQVAYCVANAVLYRYVGSPGSPPTTCDTTTGFVPLTSPEISIANFAFYVVGSVATGGGDTIQPKVTILLSGYEATKGKAPTIASCNTGEIVCAIFNLQTSVTQRIYDI